MTGDDVTIARPDTMCVAKSKALTEGYHAVRWRWITLLTRFGYLAAGRTALLMDAILAP